MRSGLALAFFLGAAAAARAGDLIPTDPRYGPLRAASHKVDVTVDNQIAMTRVEQVFANDHGVQLEAHYVFPVPRGASIIDFSMTVNGKLMRGELLEKDRARRIYEGIVQQSKDPGLLEHVGANVFRVRVFPILPGSEQKIEITTLERVTYDAGICRYVYPLLVPGSRGGTKTDRFQLRWRLASAVPITDVSCPTHPANVAAKSASAAEVTWDGRQVDLSRDLEIAYRIARPESGMDLVCHRPKDAEGTFLLLVTPRADAPRLPKDMTFVFDTSGSMEGARIRQARAALRFCLSKLAPDDRFNILAFSGDVVPFEPAHVAATDEARDRARRFADRMDALGSTNINAALLRALAHRPAPGRPHLVLFLTDGQPTAGETATRSIVRNVLEANPGGARIFAFGVGNEPDRHFLAELSDATGGVSEHVAETEDIEEKVSRLQKRIASPVITELSIDWGQAEVSAVHPRAIGDLFAGTQLAVTGRYAKGGVFEVTLRGRAGATPFEVRERLDFPERRDESPAVPYLWAMRKVAAMLEGIRRRGESEELVGEVVALARRYRIATPYTSFLVLETEAAFDQHGVERKGAGWTPPASTSKVFVPAEDPIKGKSGDSIGAGGGGGGQFGTRLGGWRDLVARGGGGGETVDAVSFALRWLARNQKADGSWDAGHEDYRVGTTGLALLAFLGAGYSHLSRDVHDGLSFGDVIRKALQYLMLKQDQEGCLAPRGAAKYMYSHAIAALALIEAYGLTGSNLFKDQAQKALDFTVAAQNPGKGWRYAARSGDSDTSVTAWAVLGLKSAQDAGLRFPKTAWDGARAWLDEVTDAGGRAGYSRKGEEGPLTPTAIAVVARIFMDRNKGDLRLAQGCDLLLREPPRWDENKNDFYAWHFATMALYQFDGPGGPKWKEWNERIKEALVRNQQIEGPAQGSWNPADRWSTEGGRVYVTALNALTLEVYYRYANVFGGRR